MNDTVFPGFSQWSPRLRRLRGMVRLLQALCLACCLALAGWAVVGTGATAMVPLRDLWVQNIGYLSAALLCACRPLLVRGHRVAWSLLATGLICRAGANIYNAAVVRTMQPRPEYSWADAGWLGLYVFVYAAIIALVFGSAARRSGATWVNGLICATGGGALVSVVVVPALRQMAGGDMIAVLVHLAYPIASAALLVLLCTAVALYGKRLSPANVVLASGLLVFLAVDIIHLVEVMKGIPTSSGRYPQVMWLVATTAIAWAAWLPDSRPAGFPHTQWLQRSFIGPVAFGVTAVGILVTATQVRITGVAVALAATTLLLVLGRAVVTIADVRTLSAARFEASTDELTGLANRRSFRRILEQALAAPAQPVAVLLLDLDRFKEVNDSLGHHVGDELLRLVAARLQSTVRSVDVLARLGGDEFAVLVRTSNRATAVSLAERILGEVRRPFELENVRLHIGASLGIAHAPDDTEDPVQLLRRADVAMYRAKYAGGGHAASETTSDAQRQDSFQLTEDLRSALTHGDLEAWYQPKCDITTGRIIGTEALVRWPHPERGLLLPPGFLDLAATAGLMPSLTEQMISMSLGQLARWRDAGFDLSVAVNLDAGTLVDDSLPDKIEVVLAQHGLPAAAVTLEITEANFITNRATAISTLTKIRALGVRASLDDYGTGYSSLSYLRDLPIDEIKLDRSFVADVISDRRTAAIISSTIELAHHLGLTVVAEGVETAAQQQRLADMGCDTMQGYLISPARQAVDVSAMLRQEQARLGPLRG